MLSLEPVDQQVLPMFRCAEGSRKQLGPAIEEMAVVFPGVSDAPMKLDHLDGHLLEGLGGGRGRREEGVEEAQKPGFP